MELGTDGVVWYREETVVFLEGDSGVDGRVERMAEEGGRREEEGRMGGRVGRTDGTGVVVWMCGIRLNKEMHRTDDWDVAMSGRGGAAETVCGIFVLETPLVRWRHGSDG